MRGDYRDLVVYQRSRVLADEVRAYTQRWPQLDRMAAGLQVLRAADSVGTNIAEAMGRYTRPDQRHLLRVARGSALELAHHLDVASARMLQVPQNGPERARELARMLNGLIRLRS